MATQPGKKSPLGKTEKKLAAATAVVEELTGDLSRVRLFQLVRAMAADAGGGVTVHIGLVWARAEPFRGFHGGR